MEVRCSWGYVSLYGGYVTEGHRKFIREGARWRP